MKVYWWSTDICSTANESMEILVPLENVSDQTGTNIAGPGNKDNIIGFSEQIQLTKMRASGLQGRAKELNRQVYLSVGFARNSRLLVYITWSCNFRQSTELEEHSHAYN